MQCEDGFRLNIRNISFHQLASHVAYYVTFFRRVGVALTGENLPGVLQMKSLWPRLNVSSFISVSLHHRELRRFWITSS